MTESKPGTAGGEALIDRALYPALHSILHRYGIQPGDATGRQIRAREELAVLLGSAESQLTVFRHGALKICGMDDEGQGVPALLSAMELEVDSEWERANQAESQLSACREELRAARAIDPPAAHDLLVRSAELEAQLIAERVRCDNHWERIKELGMKEMALQNDLAAERANSERWMLAEAEAVERLSGERERTEALADKLEEWAPIVEHHNGSMTELLAAVSGLLSLIEGPLDYALRAARAADNEVQEGDVLKARNAAETLANALPTRAWAKTPEVERLEIRRREGRGLLRRLIKYVREDRAVTPGFTRLARLVDDVDDYLSRTREPGDILRAPQPAPVRIYHAVAKGLDGAYDPANYWCTACGKEWDAAPDARVYREPCPGLKAKPGPGPFDGLPCMLCGEPLPHDECNPSQSKEPADWERAFKRLLRDVGYLSEDDNAARDVRYLKQAYQVSTFRPGEAVRRGLASAENVERDWPAWGRNAADADPLLAIPKTTALDAKADETQREQHSPSGANGEMSQVSVSREAQQTAETEGPAKRAMSQPAPGAVVSPKEPPAAGGRAPRPETGTGET